MSFQFIELLRDFKKLIIFSFNLPSLDEEVVSRLDWKNDRKSGKYLYSNRINYKMVG